jgi:adiponectin receptor
MKQDESTRDVRQRRQPGSPTSALDAAAGSVTEAASKVEHAVHDSILMLWDDLPAWRRDNAFILSGYRQSRASYLHSLRSLFYVHNESVNIWSHLLGALVAGLVSWHLYAAVRPRYEAASRGDVIAFACFFAGAVLCLGMSATFHALLNHSEAVMKWGNKLDYSGIVALIVGSYVPALYYGFFCRPDLMSIYLTVVSCAEQATEEDRETDPC